MTFINKGFVRPQPGFDAGSILSETFDYQVIIPQYGKHELTLSCLSSLLRHGVLPEKILVVDNGSESTVQNETMRSLSPGVTIFYESQCGVTHAWNRGWRNSNGEYVIFLNNDVVATGPFIAELLSPFDHPDVEIVGLKRMVDRETRELQIQGSFVHREIPRLIQGWCYAVRRCTLEKLQGFDAKLEMYFSDTDLCLRTQHASRAGTNSIYHLGSLPLVHLEHRTLRYEQGRVTTWKRDRDRFMSKWSIKYDASNASM